jgi:hypothetical protein
MEITDNDENPILEIIESLHAKVIIKISATPIHPECDQDTKLDDNHSLTSLSWLVRLVFLTMTY